MHILPTPNTCLSLSLHTNTNRMMMMMITVTIIINNFSVPWIRALGSGSRWPHTDWQLSYKNPQNGGRILKRECAWNRPLGKQTSQRITEQGLGKDAVKAYQWGEQAGRQGDLGRATPEPSERMQSTVLSAAGFLVDKDWLLGLVGRGLLAAFGISVKILVKEGRRTALW